MAVACLQMPRRAAAPTSAMAQQAAAVPLNGRRLATRGARSEPERPHTLAKPRAAPSLRQCGGGEQAMEGDTPDKPLISWC